MSGTARVALYAAQRLTGRRYGELEKMLDSATEEQARDFLRLIRDCETEIMMEKRRVPLFPGGPRIRI